jgi:hypothetical protein
MAGEGFMKGKTVRNAVWPALAVLSVFALAFGAFMASPPAVDAAGLKASLGVGCSVSNGNVKLKFKVSAEAKGGELELERACLPSRSTQWARSTPTTMSA